MKKEILSWLPLGVIVVGIFGVLGYSIKASRDVKIEKIKNEPDRLKQQIIKDKQDYDTQHESEINEINRLKVLKETKEMEIEMTHKNNIEVLSHKLSTLPESDRLSYLESIENAKEIERKRNHEIKIEQLKHDAIVREAELRSKAMIEEAEIRKATIIEESKMRNKSYNSRSDSNIVSIFMSDDD